MRWSNFTFLVKQGVSSVWYNRMMSFASFCILMVSLLLVGIAALTALNINEILAYIEDKNEIMIYLEEDLNSIDLTRISEALNKNPYVKAGGVQLKSKEQAWEEWKEKYPEQAKFYEYLESNPLPDAFIVTVSDLTQISAAVFEFRKIEGVQKVSAPNDFAEFLIGIRTTLSIIGGAVIVALIIVCLVIIYNSSRASVFSRRQEINIMKYVGATNSFVRIPFFIEGMFVGVLAGAAAWFLTMLSYDAIISMFGGELTIWQALGLGNLVDFSSIKWLVLVADCLAGAVLSATGIIMSMGKHLKV